MSPKSLWPSPSPPSPVVAQLQRSKTLIVWRSRTSGTNHSNDYYFSILTNLVQ
jgi:hypothetical protein